MGGRSLVAAQDGDTASHPIVGTWLVDFAPADPNGTFNVAVFAADGTMIDSSAEGGAAGGVWSATGETTADATYVILTDGPAHIVVRASIEVAADGQSFSGTYTNEYVIDKTGETTSEEIGPGTFEGKRIVVEAPGTPSSSFEDFFPQATPES